MMLSTIVRVSVLFHACYSTAALKLQTVVSSADGLAYDDSSRLKTQWILYTHGCEAHIDNNHLLRHSSLIMVSEMSADFAQSFIDRETMSQCLAVRLVKGMAKSLIKSPLTGDISNDEEDTSEWISRMLGVEMGWISYWPNDCTLFWINHRGEKAQITVLQPGEKNTFWTHSFMSHEFEIYDNGTGELVSRYIAEYDSFHVVGNHVLSPMEYDDPQKQIEKELKSVYFEPKAIKRTFSELGFKKGKLPPDVWSSISAYYYNNRNHMTFEEQAGASVFINWWESPCYFIGMPWGLKGRWQARLQKLVQNWIGHETPLEQTDIYGIRRYEQGARLLSHVDRITTHAVSLIINVAQENMKEPWMVEIYDFAGRLHEIEMQPGDTIYYEVFSYITVLDIITITNKILNRAPAAYMAV